eukprot:766555-Hanusia_phi.AAC.3
MRKRGSQVAAGCAERTARASKVSARDHVRAGDDEDEEEEQRTGRSDDLDQGEGLPKDKQRAHELFQQWERDCAENRSLEEQSSFHSPKRGRSAREGKLILRKRGCSYGSSDQLPNLRSLSSRPRAWGRGMW